MTKFKTLSFFIFFYYTTLLFLGDLHAYSTANNQKFYIEDISITGNTKTKENVIYENLSFGIGDSLSEVQINSAIENLQKLEIFNNVKLLPRPGSKPGYLKLTIEIKERYWPSFRFKGGYSELDGWYLTPISFNLDNIFGLGNFTSLDITFGDRITSLNFLYINPNIFYSDFDFHFKIKVQVRQYVHYINDNKVVQNVPQGGYFLGLRSRDRFFKHFLFGWQLYSTQPDSFAKDASSDEKIYSFPEPLSSYSNEKLATSAFSLFFDWDNRDQPAYPVGGWWTGIWFTQADEQIGSQTNFGRFILDIRKYTHLFSQIALAARFKYGIISSSAPFYEKFYLGGPNTLRGYPDRSISPLGGGEQFVLGGLELRLPISRKNYPDHFLTGIIFFDTGANIIKSQKLESDKFKSSYGFGLRFRLPFIGLFRMDFAYPIDGGEKRIHFSLGHTF